MSRANQPTQGVKLLYVNTQLMVGLFQMDGSRCVLIDGMPADARITGAAFDPVYDRVIFEVYSAEFPPLNRGERPPELLLTCRELEPCNVPVQPYRFQDRPAVPLPASRSMDQPSASG